MCLACGHCSVNAHSLPLTKRTQASLWFCTPPGHHPHLCRCVFWRVFGTVREKGESCSRSLPTTGSLFPSITMFHQENIAKGKWIGLCLVSAEGNSRRQLSDFSAAPALAPYHSILWCFGQEHPSSERATLGLFAQEESLTFTYKTLLIHFSHLITMILL